MTERSIASVRHSRREDVDYLEQHLPLSGTDGEMLDPFLILGHHGPQEFPPHNPGMPFGPHPHRGFETVTFILEGDLVHSDSGGHANVIQPGGVQWMTAGSGVIHNEEVSERFREDGGVLELLQLWVNLPARLKMTPPRYTGAQASEIAKVPLPRGAGTLDLVSGEFAGATGPIPSLTGVFMSIVHINEGTRVELPAPSGRSVLFYVVRGEVTVGGARIGARDIATFDDEGDAILVLASTDARILFGHAEPIGEPVVARGPFVMSSEAEIQEAYRDYRAGRFGAAMAGA